MEISVQLKGKILEKVRSGGARVVQHISMAVEKGSRMLYLASITDAPAATGTLKKSIRRDLFPLRAAIYPTVMYGIFVHEGTRPHWPPLREIKPGGSLYRWAKKKGLNPFLVARAIARRGTKANPWMKGAVEHNESAIEKIFEEATEGIVNSLKD